MSHAAESQQHGISFKEFFRGLAAGLSVVGTVDGTGKPYGATCTSLGSLSASPPLLTVSMAKDSSTLCKIQETRSFSVNILGVGGEQTLSLLSTKAPDKFAGVNWEHAYPGPGNPKILDGLVAFADCTLDTCFEWSDHAIVVGHMDYAVYGDVAEPLVYFERGYRYLLPPATKPGTNPRNSA